MVSSGILVTLDCCRFNSFCDTAALIQRLLQSAVHGGSGAGGPGSSFPRRVRGTTRGGTCEAREGFRRARGANDLGSVRAPGEGQARPFSRISYGAYQRYFLQRELDLLSKRPAPPKPGRPVQREEVLGWLRVSDGPELRGRNRGFGGGKRGASRYFSYQPTGCRGFVFLTWLFRLAGSAFTVSS